jgi:ribonuclease P protein subunit RPR2
MPQLKASAEQIAKQRIKILFQEARKVFHENPHISSRYIKQARKIAMAARTRIPKKYRRQLCKNCHMLLVQGENCRVRIRQKREPHVVITCLSCGHKTRIPIRKKKEKRFEQNNNSNETTCSL